MSLCLAIHSQSENIRTRISVSINTQINALHPDYIIKLAWILGHAGIEGNEVVDRAAAQALEIVKSKVQNIQTTTPDFFGPCCHNISFLTPSNKFLKTTVTPWEEHNGETLLCV